MLIFTTDNIGIATVIYNNFEEDKGIPPTVDLRMNINDHVDIRMPDVDYDWAQEIERKFWARELLIEPSKAFKTYGTIRRQVNTFKPRQTKRA